MARVPFSAPTASESSGTVGSSGAELLATAISMTVLALVAAVASAAGAHGVGFRDVVVEVDGEEAPHALWYPASVPSERIAVGPFTMSATRDAPLGAGEYGLVLISHGTGGGRFNHRGTAVRLAEAGYIVAAPEHAGDNWRDGGYSGTAANWGRRPRQLSAALDHVLGDPEFGPRIDAGRIGAIGHSAGGYSVLALIGARADTSVLARHCTRNRHQDPEFCEYGRPGGHVGGRLPDLSDRRVSAVVAVAPVGAVFGDGAFTGVEAPAQIHRLEGDRVLRRPWHADRIVRLMGKNARLVVHPSAHHFAYISPFPADLIGSVGRPARDPAGFDRQAFLSGIDRQVLAFFDEILPVGPRPPTPLTPGSSAGR